MSGLREELTALLNRHSAENVSNTPDWILASYLETCLGAFDTATQKRDRWYGVVLAPGGVNLRAVDEPPAATGGEGRE